MFRTCPYLGGRCRYIFTSGAMFAPALVSAVFFSLCYRPQWLNEAYRVCLLVAILVVLNACRSFGLPTISLKIPLTCLSPPGTRAIETLEPFPSTCTFCSSPLSRKPEPFHFSDFTPGVNTDRERVGGFKQRWRSLAGTENTSIPQRLPDLCNINTSHR